MTRQSHVKVDVLPIKNGLIENVHVFLDIVGGINNAEDAQKILILAQINQHVFQKIQTPTTTQKIIKSTNVEKMRS